MALAFWTAAAGTPLSFGLCFCAFAPLRDKTKISKQTHFEILKLLQFNDNCKNQFLTVPKTNPSSSTTAPPRLCGECSARPVQAYSKLIKANQGIFKKNTFITRPLGTLDCGLRTLGLGTSSSVHHCQPLPTPMGDGWQG